MLNQKALSAFLAREGKKLILCADKEKVQTLVESLFPGTREKGDVDFRNLEEFVIALGTEVLEKEGTPYRIITRKAAIERINALLSDHMDSMQYFKSESIIEQHKENVGERVMAYIENGFSPLSPHEVYTNTEKVIHADMEWLTNRYTETRKAERLYDPDYLMVMITIAFGISRIEKPDYARVGWFDEIYDATNGHAKSVTRFLKDLSGMINDWDGLDANFDHDDPWDA